MYKNYKKIEQLKTLLEYQSEYKQRLRDLNYQYQMLMEYFYSTNSPNEANDKLYFEELEEAEDQILFVENYISLFDRIKRNKRKRFWTAKDLKNVKLEIQTFYKNYNNE